MKPQAWLFQDCSFICPPILLPNLLFISWILLKILSLSLSLSREFSELALFWCTILYSDWLKQEDFIWQEIWRTSIHLFKVVWYDHLVNHFPLMYRYGINTNILHLTFSCAEFWSFRIKYESLQEYLMKK